LARRCFLIVNPTSGSFSQTKINRILASLREAGLDPVLMPTGSPLDAALFAARLCAEVPDPLILVAGGDGTVNGVLNGLTPGVATLGVIPLGTSNVLARELSIHSIDQALKRVTGGRTRPIPVGELVCAAANRRFLLMAGVGVDGAVVRGVRHEEKRLLGKGAYLLSALRLIFAWDREELQVVCAGKSLSCDSVIVCNAGKYGGNFQLAPEGAIFSPGFQVFCIRGGRLSYLKLAFLLALGRVRASRSVTILKASELEISGRKAIQLDGDFFGCAPLRIRSVPDFVRLIV
jgi:diacylglycerol kinase (ATP)